jgi:hypothetical protein
VALAQDRRPLDRTLSGYERFRLAGAMVQVGQGRQLLCSRIAAILTLVIEAAAVTLDIPALALSFQAWNKGNIVQCTIIGRLHLRDASGDRVL